MIYKPLDDTQRYLFLEGNNAYAYRFLGSHKTVQDGQTGYRFTVWAPEAKAVSVVGDFCDWIVTAHPMTYTPGGLWTLFLPLGDFSTYKYAVLPAKGGWTMKCDPYGVHAETRPLTGSKTYDLAGYQWGDDAFMKARAVRNPYTAPMNIYEMHLGSWKLDEERRPYTYARLKDELPPYLKAMGYTHVQFLPVMEHPLDGSWGYQVTGFYAPTSRYGTPKEFMALVDACHQAGIFVLLDWVPAHFPRDGHGLGRFDGTALYEHADPRRGEHRVWGTYMFNHGRNEVRSFLLSNAVYWLSEYHADGLRVDAVSFMIYQDYLREKGDWVPNRYGGRENIEAIDFLRKFNEIVYRDFPGVTTIAEEATSYPMVTQPTYLGGLGFGFKWNMGWMHDTLDYVEMDPVYRKYRHDKLTFSLMYAFSENYVLPLSHDEVVHGKRSLLNKHPGDQWKQFAGLRALFGYQMAHPGKKLVFMGGEYGQYIEWKDDDSLDWHLLAYPMHEALHRYVRTLNHLYRQTPALFEQDDSWAGFTWLSANDQDNSVIAFCRFAKADGGPWLIAVLNWTPVYHPVYRIGVPLPGVAYQILNSDEATYGGSGQGNPLPIAAQEVIWNERPYSIELSVPPLSCVYLRYEFLAPPAPAVLPSALPEAPAKMRKKDTKSEP